MDKTYKNGNFSMTMNKYIAEENKNGRVER